MSSLTALSGPRRSPDEAMGGGGAEVSQRLQNAESFGRFLSNLQVMLQIGVQIPDAINALAENAGAQMQPSTHSREDGATAGGAASVTPRENTLSSYMDIDALRQVNPLLRQIITTGDKNGTFRGVLSVLVDHPEVWRKMALADPLDKKDTILLLGIMLVAQPDIGKSLNDLSNGLARVPGYSEGSNSPDTQVRSILRAFSGASGASASQRLGQAFTENCFPIAAAICRVQGSLQPLGQRLITAATKIQ